MHETLRAAVCKMSAETPPLSCVKAFERARCCRPRGCGAPNGGRRTAQGLPLNRWQQLPVGLGMFHCFECIESGEKPAPATAAEQPGPLPAAGEISLGTVSSAGLVTHVAFSASESIRAPICSLNPNPGYCASSSVYL